MNEQEVKDIVAKTIDELFDRNWISEDTALNYQVMGDILWRHYHNRADRRVGIALEQIKGDEYFRIIPEYYQNNKTLIWIAVTIGCDRVTVARNKKRLVLELYKIYRNLP